VARQVWVRPAKTGHGRRGPSRPVRASRELASGGRAALAGHGGAGSGQQWRVQAWQAGRGLTRMGNVRLGMAGADGLGKQGEARCGWAGKTRHVATRPRKASHVAAWRRKASPGRQGVAS
jgi:hypothetical protein